MGDTEDWRSVAKLRLTMTNTQIRVAKKSLQMFIAPRDRKWGVLCKEIVESYGGAVRLGGDYVVQSAIRLFQEAEKVACCDGYVRSENCSVAESIIEILNVTDNDVGEEKGIILPYASVVILQKALEEYIRVRYGQWLDLADAISANGYRYDKAVPNNHDLFERYISRRNEAYDILCAAGRMVIPRVANKPEDCMIAEDMFRVIRHFLFALEYPHGRKEYDIRATEPLLISDEPPIKIAVIRSNP